MTGTLETHDGALHVVTRDRLSTDPILITRRFKVLRRQGGPTEGDHVTTEVGKDGWSNGRVRVWTSDATITETPIAQPPNREWRDGGWRRRG